MDLLYDLKSLFKEIFLAWNPSFYILDQILSNVYLGLGISITGKRCRSARGYDCRWLNQGMR